MRFLLCLGPLVASVADPPSSQTAVVPPSRTTYVIVHGAWGGSWDWRQVDSILTGHGHLVYRPALTGLGERVHLASPSIGLDTHITDIVNVLVWEDLRDVVLVGHSYGGMVITGVADRVPERIRHLIYLDAFLPDSGESMRRLARPETATLIDRYADTGMVPPVWVDSIAQIPKDVPQPLRTMTDPLVLTNRAARRIPGTYILTVEPGLSRDPFTPFAKRAAARGWRVLRMEAGHVPNRTQPVALAALLEGVR
ncbi:MAG: alpha/beta fold hydrolase [Gemmatimonadota bacterium]